MSLTFDVGVESQHHRWARRLWAGCYEICDEDGHADGDIVQVRAPVEHVAAHPEIAGVFVGGAIDPQRWSVGVVELRAGILRATGRLEVLPDQRCRCCGGDATECYARHAVGRSCA